MSTTTAQDLLVRARTTVGLTQAALARKAGITRSVLNAYERGTREPGANTLTSILRAAGFDVRLVPRIDLERNGRILAQLLDLADSLPIRPKRALAYPPFARRVG